MHAITQSAVWIKEPSADAGVVIVTSAALPPYMIDKLHVAIDEWDQVAYLAIKQSEALRLDWLQVGSSPEPSDGTYASPCQSTVARRPPTAVFLLDVETGTDSGMTVAGGPSLVIRCAWSNLEQ